MGGEDRAGPRPKPPCTPAPLPVQRALKPSLSPGPAGARAVGQRHLRCGRGEVARGGGEERRPAAADSRSEPHRARCLRCARARAQLPVLSRARRVGAARPAAAGTISPTFRLPEALKTWKMGFNSISGTFPEDLVLPAGLEEINLPWWEWAGGCARKTLFCLRTCAPRPLQSASRQRQRQRQQGSGAAGRSRLRRNLPGPAPAPCRCHFTGSFPGALAQAAPKLTYLALDHNGFSGSILPDWFNGSSLTWVDVSWGRLPARCPLLCAMRLGQLGPWQRCRRRRDFLAPGASAPQVISLGACQGSGGCTCLCFWVLERPGRSALPCWMVLGRKERRTRRWAGPSAQERARSCRTHLGGSFPSILQNRAN